MRERGNYFSSAHFCGASRLKLRYNNDKTPYLPSSAFLTSVALVYADSVFKQNDNICTMYFCSIINHMLDIFWFYYCRNVVFGVYMQLTKRDSNCVINCLNNCNSNRKYILTS